MATPKTAIQGGNLAYFCQVGTTADGLSTVLMTYDKLTNVDKTSHPNLGDWALSLTNANLDTEHETFVTANLKEVTSTDPVVIAYTDNTEDKVAEAPTGATEGFLISTGGIVNSSKRRLYIQHGYLSSVTESADAPNTPVTTVDSFTSTGISATTILTSASIDALMSAKGTIASDVTISAGSYGSIAYLVV